MPSPTLVVVSGPPGTGKMTLAHAIAAAIGCPAICRDEIKEGMVHAAETDPSRSDHLNRRVLATFFDVLRLLLSVGVTTVAEAAFQDRLWRPGLEPLVRLAKLCIIRCTVSPDVAHARVARRLADNPGRAAHDDRRYLQTGALNKTDPPGTFGWITLPAPTLTVDTCEGYNPPLANILAFINAPNHDAGHTNPHRTPR